MPHCQKGWTVIANYIHLDMYWRKSLSCNILSQGDRGGQSGKRNIPSRCPPPCGHKTRRQFILSPCTMFHSQRRQGRQARKGTFLLDTQEVHPTQDGHKTRSVPESQDKVSILQGQGGQGKTRSVPESWTRCPFYKDKGGQGLRDKECSWVLDKVSILQGQVRTRQDKECSWVLYKVSIPYKDKEGQGKTRSVPESWTRSPSYKDKTRHSREVHLIQLPYVHPVSTTDGQAQDPKGQDNQRDSYLGWQALGMEGHIPRVHLPTS